VGGKHGNLLADEGEAWEIIIRSKINDQEIPPTTKLQIAPCPLSCPQAIEGAVT